MTNIPAALRPEIEAVEEAAVDVADYESRPDHPHYEPKRRRARDFQAEARAALCAKVERLMLRAAYTADETAWGMPNVVTELLNEEPKADDG